VPVATETFRCAQSSSRSQEAMETQLSEHKGSERDTRPGRPAPLEIEGAMPPAVPAEQSADASSFAGAKTPDQTERMVRNEIKSGRELQRRRRREMFPTPSFADHVGIGSQPRVRPS